MHITHTLGISENFDFEGFHNIPSPFHIKYNTTPSSQTFAKAFWLLLWHHQANYITFSSGISDREKNAHGGYFLVVLHTDTRKQKHTYKAP